MAILEKLLAREVLDSRGHPTIEVEVVGSDGARGRAVAPSGGSVGPHEAQELRDSHLKRHGGRGVERAVALVRGEVGPALVGLGLDDQGAIDAALIALDGTLDKSRLGSHAILAASIASAQAAASSRGEPLYVHLNRLWKARLPLGEPSGLGLPLPMAHMICGTSHAGRSLDFQDILMVPVGARDLPEAVAMIADVYRNLGDVLHQHGHPAHLISCQGGYGPKLWASAQAVDHLLEAVLKAGLSIEGDVVIALDVAAQHIRDPATGEYRLDNGHDRVDSGGMVAMLEHWARQYPIASIEDPLGEDDWDGWAAINARLGDRIQVAGDDLFASRADRIALGSDRKAANAAVIKPGQVGTLTETLDALAELRARGLRAIIAGRWGETEDTAVADLAVATASGQVKFGSLARAERVVKYNRLLRIAEDLGPAAPYAGREALRPAASGNGRNGHQPH